MTSSTSDDLIKVMRKSGQVWRTALNHALEAVDLTLMQWAVLDLAFERPNLSQVEMARILGIDGASLVRILDNLETRHWLTRAADESDRRVKRICLRMGGLAQWKDVEAQIKFVHEKALASMPDQDRRTLCRLVEQMSENLTKVSEMPS